jgi:hypothetical protein
MTPQAALIELLGRVGASNGSAVLISTQELSQWPTAAVSALKSQNLLLKARPANSVVCPGCEEECSMPVETLTRANAPATFFVVCDKRSDTNRVAVTAAQLAQWRCDAQAVCGFVATGLGLRETTVQPSEAGLLPIGMARGNKRTQMLCLRAQVHLALVVGADAMPLADVIDFKDGRFMLDMLVIRQMVDAAITADPRHTPSTVKREARKISTQAMYADWQKAYRALRKKRPGESGVWYSERIAKSQKHNPLGRDANTIKKHMLA